MSFYRPKDFRLEEYAPPDVFHALGERAWGLLDPRMLATDQALREKFGPITINDWLWGGSYTESGFRHPRTTTGADFSQHRFGRASDKKFRDATVQEVYEYILAHPNDFPLLTTMENIAATPTWLHSDVRNHDKPGIWIVNPITNV